VVNIWASPKMSIDPMSLGSIFKFLEVLKESTWTSHDTSWQPFVKMQKNETKCQPCIISKFASYVHHWNFFNNELLIISFEQNINKILNIEYDICATLITKH